ncbi:uncharacterized protein LOC129797827 [Lutzomyia longipalpis]|uniref:uncharacterized protein LOC129791123 n=1 Tax=Lutzomyia longipalpis TaxID=7200 RepID=UPI0024845726|nr:uncharacterized protein LOC129791123 [Lutzomyia longipalpis]XP_055696452.1 uncharacterized protein LOC129797680 [Lutzomyia longipalpis]XP_055696643.1 uncharacterized protein LOC129797827 [Lutzomyia longipalpis]
MSSLIGSIESFVPGDNFKNFRDRLESLLSVNKITEEDQRKNLAITLMGATAYDTLVTLLSPKTPSEVTYKKIMETLLNHYEVKNNVIAERCQFHMRNRKDGESVNDYIVEIKAMADKCEFGAFLEEALRDRLVSGINDQVLQQKLILQSNLTWERAKETSIIEFRTRRNVQEMGQAIGGVNLMSKQSAHAKRQSSGGHQRHRSRHREGAKGQENRSSAPSGASCDKCGLQHAQGQCKAAKSNCRMCGKKGHWAAMCRSGKTLTSLHATTMDSFNPMYLKLNVDGQDTKFEGSA